MKGTDAFFKKYQARAKAAGVDPLGYYLGGWGYAYFQVLGEAIKGAKEPQRRQARRLLCKKATFKTIMGDEVRRQGEWAKSRMLQVQYHDINRTPPTSRPGAA